MVAPGAQRHDDLLEGGVAGSLPDAVDRRLDLPDSSGDASQRVRGGEAEIVVGVDREHHVPEVHAGSDPSDQRAELVGQRPADGVRDVDRRSASLDRHLDRRVQELGIAAGRVLRGELDVFAQAPRVGHRVADPAEHLAFGHLELVAHVYWRRGQERVEPRFGRRRHRLPRGVDVLAVGPSQGADRRRAHAVGLRHLLGDAPNRLGVVGRGGREAGLDHVHAEGREGVGDVQLLAWAERHPW